MLDVLGLDRGVEAVYRAMLAHPEGSVQDLCCQLGVPESTVRNALDKLADLRLLRASRDVLGEMRPVSPELGLEMLLRRQEEELLRRRQELELGKAAAARAIAEYADFRPATRTATSERLVGLDAIQARLEGLAREMSDECLSVMPGGAQSQASLDASRPLDDAALGRGISVLTLYQDSVRRDPATLAYARWMTEGGGMVRTCPTLPPRMLVFDRRVAVVPIDPGDTKRGAICISEAGVVASLVALFEQTWHSAVPLGADRSKDARTGLSPSEQELLTLLASGLTDEVAGRRLGISARSVRRQMAGLMERLDASSRFEAGLKAAQRGWLQ
ncbi:MULTISPECIES: helix-turn-helix transcriptional regulator [Streptomyces]|uniref:helix-turn-helix transcriptional regulator n=1 Tax=Streptomyces TaxID=1883 RepID=UPI002E1305C8|nr:LuxR C-terminal-related transcriptional regulator [Streptomyces sp. NBC_01207]WTA20975.1 LuxR C-terminal-related transcriptional regulator [Streptomyces sp. NBC_00853]